MGILRTVARIFRPKLRVEFGRSKSIAVGDVVLAHTFDGKPPKQCQVTQLIPNPWYKEKGHAKIQDGEGRVSRHNAKHLERIQRALPPPSI